MTAGPGRCRLTIRVPALNGMIAALLVGCGSDGERAGDTDREQLEGAAVAVVDNTVPVLSGTVRVAGAPSVIIGAADAPEEGVLHRVVAALRLTDGRLAVLNGGVLEVRYYDAAGRFLRRSGRQGSGPGEFQAFTYWQRLLGDSILVYDARE